MSWVSARRLQYFFNKINALFATKAAVNTAQGLANSVNTRLNTHSQDTSNPHGVTKSQVGLGNVDNVKQLPITGGELTGELIVNENFRVRISYEDVPYRSYVKPVAYSINNDGVYSTGLIHYHNDANDSQLIFNKSGVILRDNVNNKAYKLYGQHFNPTAAAVGAMPITGGGFQGNVWASSRPSATDWNFKNACVRDSGGYAITGNTAVIEFRRK